MGIICSSGETYFCLFREGEVAWFGGPMGSGLLLVLELLRNWVWVTQLKSTVDVKYLLKEETFKLVGTGKLEGTQWHSCPGTHTYLFSLHPPQLSSAAPQLGPQAQEPGSASAGQAPMVTDPALLATACYLEVVSLAVEIAVLEGRPKWGWGVQVNSRIPLGRPQLWVHPLRKPQDKDKDSCLLCPGLPSTHFLLAFFATDISSFISLP